MITSSPFTIHDHSLETYPARPDISTAKVKDACNLLTCTPWVVNPLRCTLFAACACPVASHSICLQRAKFRCHMDGNLSLRNHANLYYTSPGSLFALLLVLACNPQAELDKRCGGQANNIYFHSRLICAGLIGVLGLTVLSTCEVLIY